jgi:hypothetical protein
MRPQADLKPIFVCVLLQSGVTSRFGSLVDTTAINNSVP